VSDDNVLNDLKSKFQRLLELREKRDQASAAEKSAKKEYREYEAQLYEELTDADQRGTLTFNFGGKLGEAKFGKRSTTFGRVIDKQAAIAALRKEGLDDAIVQESIAEGRLNELVRERHETGTELPEGIDFYNRAIITISRKKGVQPDALDV
jgi:hypothetical protein